jgi:hypothetical protein
MITRLLALLVVVLISGSCSSIQNITQSLTNLRNMQFKLGAVRGFRLAGVDLSKVSDPKKLSVADALALTQAFAQKRFPATFTLDVEARNPNTGQGGTRQSAVTLSKLDWRLLIDDVQTIAGDIQAPVEVPGNGQATVIPLGVTLDLYQFFADKGMDGIVNLATAIGGVNGSAARLKLDAMPTVSTPFGPMQYPGRITIVDKEYR